MAPGSDGSAPVSSTLATLVGMLCLAWLLGSMVVRDAVNKTVEHRTLAIAETVANQGALARSGDASEVVARLRRDGFGPADGSEKRPVHVPIPAQFLKLVGHAASVEADRLYADKPVSRWNPEPGRGLTDDFLRRAWPRLEVQGRPSPTAPVEWPPVSRLEEQGGRLVLRFLAADPASQMACATCHNADEQPPEVLALHTAAGVAPGRQFAQHQLMGALSITVPAGQGRGRGG